MTEERTPESTPGGKRGGTIILLSPANLNGVRARQLMAPTASFAAARAYQTDEGVEIADAFAFMSALYFRGKIAYARRFATPPPASPGGAVFVIAPGFGLVEPTWRITRKRMATLKKTEVDVNCRAYRRPLELAARAMATTLDSDSRVVLLGSVATGKYVDVLWPILGDRLLFPRCFAGLGDMSRGSLLLRAAQSGEELDYVQVAGRRHVGSGKRTAEGGRV